MHKVPGILIHSKVPSVKCFLSSRFIFQQSVSSYAASLLITQKYCVTLYRKCGRAVWMVMEMWLNIDSDNIRGRKILSLAVVRSSLLQVWSKKTTFLFSYFLDQNIWNSTCTNDCSTDLLLQTYYWHVQNFNHQEEVFDMKQLTIIQGTVTAIMMKGSSGF